MRQLQDNEDAIHGGRRHLHVYCQWRPLLCSHTRVTQCNTTTVHPRVHGTAPLRHAFIQTHSPQGQGDVVPQQPHVLQRMERRGAACSDGVVIHSQRCARTTSSRRPAFPCAEGMHHHAQSGTTTAARMHAAIPPLYVQQRAAVATARAMAALQHLRRGCPARTAVTKRSPTIASSPYSPSARGSTPCSAIRGAGTGT